jgi:hypothetical protein
VLLHVVGQMLPPIGANRTGFRAAAPNKVEIPPSWCRIDTGFHRPDGPYPPVDGHHFTTAARRDSSASSTLTFCSMVLAIMCIHSRIARSRRSMSSMWQIRHGLSFYDGPIAQPDTQHTDSVRTGA